MYIVLVLLYKILVFLYISDPNGGNGEWPGLDWWGISGFLVEDPLPVRSCQIADVSSTSQSQTKCISNIFIHLQSIWPNNKEKKNISLSKCIFLYYQIFKHCYHSFKKKRGRQKIVHPELSSKPRTRFQDRKYPGYFHSFCLLVKITSKITHPQSNLGKY